MQMQVFWIEKMQMQMFWFPKSKCKCFDANVLDFKNTNENVLDSKKTNANETFSNANAFAFEPKPVLLQRMTVCGNSVSKSHFGGKC